MHLTDSLTRARGLTTGDVRVLTELYLGRTVNLTELARLSPTVLLAAIQGAR